MLDVITRFRAFAPVLARLILRYGIGFIAGVAIGDAASADPDLVLMVAGGLSIGVEAAYTYAKKHGGET